MCSLELFRNFLQKITATLDPSVWRQRSRVVAYLEMAISTINLIWAIILLIYTADLTINIETIKKELALESPGVDPSSRVMSVTNHWIILIFRATVVSIDVWASVLLIKSTKVGADPKIALERARNWVYISATIAISTALLTAYKFSIIYAVVVILFRVAFLAVVSKFIAELKRGIDAAAGFGDGNFLEVPA